jgi:hypothetical protein
VGYKSIAQKFKQTVQANKEATAIAAREVEAVEEAQRENEERSNCLLTVGVTRGPTVNSHPSYEVSFLASPFRPLLSLTLFS